MILQYIYNGIARKCIKSADQINYLLSLHAMDIRADSYDYAVGINDTVAHTLDKDVFIDGDLVSVDTWFNVDGTWIDAAITAEYGNGYNKLVDITRGCVIGGLHHLNDLYRKNGEMRCNDYGKFVSKVNTGQYKIIGSLSGHDITDKIHGGLRIRNIDSDDDSQLFEIGKRYALETLINSSGEFCRDTWKSTDGSKSAHWELTVDMTNKGLEVVYGYCY